MGIYIKNRYFLTCLLLSLFLILSACTSSPSTTTTTSSTTSYPPLANTIEVSSKSGIGQYMVNAEGMSLYYTSQDEPGEPDIFIPGVPEIWPIFYTDTIIVPPELNPALFINIMRVDSRLQTMYYGHPLYLYTGDTKPGDTNGNGIDGVWFLAVLTDFNTVTPTTPAGG